MTHPPAANEPSVGEPADRDTAPAHPTPTDTDEPTTTAAPAAEAAAEPLLEPTAELDAEPLLEPAVEPAAEPVLEPAAAPAAESAATESAAGSFAEPVDEPAAETVSLAAGEPAAETASLAAGEADGGLRAADDADDAPRYEADYVTPDAVEDDHAPDEPTAEQPLQEPTAQEPPQFEPIPPSAPHGATGPPPPFGTPPGAFTGPGGFNRRALIRPTNGRYIAGVCAAVGRATNTDPILWRVLFAVMTLAGGIGLLAYLLGWLLIPAEGDTGSPVEAMFGRGRTTTSPPLVIIIAVAAVLTFAWVVSRNVGSAVLGLAVIVGTLALLARNNNQRHQPEQPPFPPPPPTYPGFGGYPSGPPTYPSMQRPPSGPMQSPMPGAMPGPMQSPMPGQMPGQMQSPMPGQMPGQMSSPMSGAMPSPTSSPVSGQMQGPGVGPAGPSTAQFDSTGLEDAPVTSPAPPRPPAPPRLPGPPWPPAPPLPPGGYRPPFAPHGPYASTSPYAASLGYRMAPNAPMGAYPGLVPPPPKPPKPPRQRSKLGRLTLSVVAIALGLLFIVNLNGASIPAPVYLATILFLISAGLIVGAWFGRARWLIPIGVVMTIVLAVGASANHFTGAENIANIDVTPATLSDVQSNYSTDVGNIHLDLSQIDFAGQTVDIEVDSTVGGNVEVILPATVDAIVKTDIQGGNCELFGKDQGGGLNQQRTVTDNGTDGQGGGTLNLTVDVNFGNVEVHR